MFTIGTAGHVDHGKSTLVEVLTGIDPDRLREEKERGMTIDLGFAWLHLPDGREVSVVDVPGHERFIRNMLAGIGGIDAALLVIAADEGVMPQTREHLEILDLLGVRHAVVVLTKSDLVDEEWCELVAAEVAEVLGSTSLANAPIVPVSARTGAGIPQLLATLLHVLDGVPEKRDMGRARLPVDRVFTLPGFGTIVTGTLRDGTMSVGQELEVVPEGVRTRARGVQSHRTSVAIASPGRRVAINLASVATTEIGRGSVLAVPGSLTPTLAIDVYIRVVASVSRPLTHGVLVAVHAGTGETVARLIMLESDRLEPGASGWVTLRLAHPIAVASGDDVIIRALSPSETLGGGRIIDAHPVARRRRQASVIEALESMRVGSPHEVLLAAVARAQPCTATVAIAVSGIDTDRAPTVLAELLARSHIVPVGDMLVTADGWRSLRDQLVTILATYHLAFPLRGSMSREDLRTRARLTPKMFGGAVSRLVAMEEVAESGAGVRAAGHMVSITGGQREAADALLDTLRNTPFAPKLLSEVRREWGMRLPVPTPIDDELIGALVMMGEVVRVTDEIVLRFDAFTSMVRTIEAEIDRSGVVTVAQARDLIGTSRKYVLPVLELLDRERYTRRVGDNRVRGSRPFADALLAPVRG